MALLMRLQHFHDNCELEMLDLGTIMLYFLFVWSLTNKHVRPWHSCDHFNLTLQVCFFRYTVPNSCSTSPQMPPARRNKNRHKWVRFLSTSEIWSCETNEESSSDHSEFSFISLTRWFSSFLWLQTKQKQISISALIAA